MTDTDQRCELCAWWGKHWIDGLPPSADCEAPAPDSCGHRWRMDADEGEKCIGFKHRHGPPAGDLLPNVTATVTPPNGNWPYPENIAHPFADAIAANREKIADIMQKAIADVIAPLTAQVDALTANLDLLEKEAYVTPAQMQAAIADAVKRHNDDMECHLDIAGAVDESIKDAITTHAKDLDAHADIEGRILDRAIGEARSADEEERLVMQAAVDAKLERIMGEHVKAEHEAEGGVVIERGGKRYTCPEGPHGGDKCGTVPMEEAPCTD